MLINDYFSLKLSQLGRTIMFSRLEMKNLKHLQANKQVFKKSTQYWVSTQYIAFLPLCAKFALAPPIFELDLYFLYKMKIKSFDFLSTSSPPNRINVQNLI